MLTACPFLVLATAAPANTWTSSGSGAFLGAATFSAAVIHVRSCGAGGLLSDRKECVEGHARPPRLPPLPSAHKTSLLFC